MSPPNHTVLTRSYLHGLVVLVVKKRCASPSHAEATSNRVKQRANSIAQIACSRHARIVWEKPKRNQRCFHQFLWPHLSACKLVQLTLFEMQLSNNTRPPRVKSIPPQHVGTAFAFSAGHSFLRKGQSCLMVLRLPPLHLSQHLNFSGGGAGFS